MSFAISFRNALLANTALVAHTASRVYYLRFPQDSIESALVFEPSANVVEQTYAGQSVLSSPEVKLMLRSSSLADGEEMRAAIVNQWNAHDMSLAGYSSVQCLVNDLGAEYDEKLDVYIYHILLNLKTRTD